MKVKFSIWVSIVIFVSFFIFVSCAQRTATVQNNQAAGSAKTTPPPLLTAHQVLDSSEREPKSTNAIAGESSSNAMPPDVYEVGVLKAIEETKLEIQTPGLNTNYQHSLKWLLRQLQGQLADHRAQVQRENAFVKSVQANPRTAWTNMMDPITEAFTMDVAHYERELASPDLAPNERETDTAMLADYKLTLADHQTNAQLWADLHMAQQNNDADQIVQSQKRLAEYLAIKLGQMQGKTYPPGMSLDAVMDEYQKHIEIWNKTNGLANPIR